MSRMKRTLLGFGVLWLVGCGGPSEEVDHAKSPDEIIAEQERLGAEQERKSKEHAQYSGNLNAEETDLEKKQQFDKKQTKLELQRATRSAETCTGVMTDKDTPRGTGKVTLVFDNEGHGFTKKANEIRAYKAILDFLDRYLKNGEAVSSR